MLDPLTDFHIDPTQLTATELAALADTYQGLQDRKVELSRTLDELKSEAMRVKKLLLAALEYQNVTSIGGFVSRCTVTTKMEPRAVSWADTYAHILATGEFDLLHRRLATEAVRQRWAADVEVPGVERVIIRDLSVSRVR